MVVVKIFLFLFKNIVIIALLVLIAGRFFFPKITEQTIITPARRMPVFGQVLGTTWDSAGNLGPGISQRTVNLADKIEKTDLPINETILELAQSDDPAKVANEAVEKNIDQKVQNLQNLPTQTLEQIKEELKKEMYKQICSGWLDEKENP